MRSPLGNRTPSRESLAPLVTLFLVLLFVLGTPLRVPLRATAIALATPLWSLGKKGTALAEKVFPSIFAGMALATENDLLKKATLILGRR